MSAASQFKIHGLCSATCTPMNSDGSLNLEIIPKYIDHFVAYGVPNAFVTGTGGESMSLTVEERKRFTEVWLKESKGKLSANIIHIGTANLADSKELAAHAEKHGADSISAVSPNYFKPTTIDTYVEYMRQVAAAAPNTPFYLYDVDFFTDIKFSASEFFDAAQNKIPTLCGLKHTSVNFDSIQKILADHPNMQLLMGTNHMFLQGLALGVESTVGNSHFGVALNRMVAAFNKGDLKSARIEQERLMRLQNLLATQVPNLGCALKGMQKILGLDCGQPRLPQAPFTNQHIENLKKELTGIGFFEWGVPTKT